jgi:hypothetical protein
VELVTDNLIHPELLPFTEEELGEHFRFTRKEDSALAHVRRFKKSADKHLRHASSGPPRTLSETKSARQAEKDETFWTAAALMGFYRSDDPQARFADLLLRAFPDGPPAGDFADWEAALAGDLRLYFEVGLRSPEGYQNWLRKHLAERNLVRYVIETPTEKSKLEGWTHLDAMLLCPETEFSAHIEAKVTSDISYGIDYDLVRNQIARNLDVMLEGPSEGDPPQLRPRDARKSVFILLSPSMFKHESEHRSARLYGWLMQTYQSSAEALKRDLVHRVGREDEPDWEQLRRRIGWLTWRDCEEVLPESCGWAKAGPDHPALRL